MLTIDEGTKAYVAGVVDMAGVIRLRPRPEPNPPLPYLGLSSPNQQIMAFLAGLTDSKVTTTHRKYSRHKCTEHCPREHLEIASTSYRWSVTGVKATVVLANIRGFLVFQTAEADAAYAAGLAANYKPATYKRMASLGWSLPVRVTRDT